MRPSTRPKLVIVGSGGHGHVILDVLLRQDRVLVVGFLDDREELLGTNTHAGVPVVGTTDWSRLAPGLAEVFTVAIGNNKVRRTKFIEATEVGLAAWSAIHPAAVIADSVEMGEGVQIMAEVTVNPFSHIGSNVILNTNCTVEHDCRIGEHVFVGSGATLGGGVEVGEMARLDLGVIIMPHVKIGEGAIIEAGAVVTEDVEPWNRIAGVSDKRSLT